VPVRSIIRRFKRNANRGIVLLVGVQTNQFARAIDIARELRDAVLVNQVSSAIALAGARDREEHRVGFMERLAPAYGDDWWYQSALAFTLRGWT